MVYSKECGEIMGYLGCMREGIFCRVELSVVLSCRPLAKARGWKPPDSGPPRI